MRRVFAEAANALGHIADGRHMTASAKFFYNLAWQLDKRWSAPLYNLGLVAKYAGSWQESLELNQRAVEIDPKNEAAWWNLGIAATALHDWAKARMAWSGYGIEIPDSDGEVRIPPVSACVRLNPSGDGEVVWGERLDPARIAILNVPLPGSKRRFYDIILNDGAPNGTRSDGIREVPVFDELAIWRASSYATFQVNVNIPNKTALERLVHLCKEQELGIEDWSTIRYICTACSQGNLGPHDCKAGDEKLGRHPYGFAARSESDLVNILAEWAREYPEADYGAAELLLAATAV